MFGTVAALVVVWVTKSIDVGIANAAGISTSGKIVLFVIAFVVGFQQDYFKELIKRVAAILLTKPETGPGSGQDTPPEASALELRGDLQFGDVPVDTSAVREITIANLTDQELTGLAVAVMDASDGITVAPASLANLAGRATTTATVTFSPTSKGTPTGRLTASRNGEALDHLPIKGRGR
ncbi:hypothetical protein [Microbacterium sp. P5_E9]